MELLQTLLRLSFEFFQTGLFSVGGGLATLPFLYAISASTGWYTTSDISNMIAVSESTPGPIGVNMATYVGYKTAGVIGAIVATLSLVCPSIIVITLVARVLKKFQESEVVKRIFYGLRPASTGLIAAAGLSVAKISFLHLDNDGASNILSLINWPMIILAVAIYVGIKVFNKHPILYIAIAAACGVVFKL